MEACNLKLNGAKSMMPFWEIVARGVTFVTHTYHEDVNSSLDANKGQPVFDFNPNDVAVKTPRT
jgi:hypothetical protein